MKMIIFVIFIESMRVGLVVVKIKLIFEVMYVVCFLFFIILILILVFKENLIYNEVLNVYLYLVL